MESSLAVYLRPCSSSGSPSSLLAASRRGTSTGRTGRRSRLGSTSLIFCLGPPVSCLSCGLRREGRGRRRGGAIIFEAAGRSSGVSVFRSKPGKAIGGGAPSSRRARRRGRILSSDGVLSAYGNGYSSVKSRGRSRRRPTAVALICGVCRPWGRASATSVCTDLSL